jgi:transposase InsO family protein
VILSAVADAQRAGARLTSACDAIGISARTVERWRTQPGADDRRAGPRRRPHNAYTPAEEERVIAVLKNPHYAGLSPKQLVPRVADEGRFVASESKLYRLQRQLGLRPQKRPVSQRDVARATTMHTATRPNQVWSWDITWLPSTIRGEFYYLYLVMDVWSRRIVGWSVELSESSELAAALAQRVCREQCISPGSLVLHSDNGSAMRGNTMLATLQRLGVMPSFSRPHVSNDNPYSESLFRTLKHTPAYPKFPFHALDDATRWVRRFVDWYNTEHRHGGIRFVTPDERHSGREHQVLARRDAVYKRAQRAHPERWTGNTRNWTPIGPVKLNPQCETKAAA